MEKRVKMIQIQNSKIRNCGKSYFKAVYHENTEYKDTTTQKLYHKNTECKEPTRKYRILVSMINYLVVDAVMWMVIYATVKCKQGT